MLKAKIVSPNLQSQLFSNSQRKDRKHTAELSDPITISFLSDIKQNIDTLLNKIHCSQQNKTQIKSILNFYADKIIKLREQRNFYKNLLALQDSRKQQELIRLQQKVTELQRQLLLQKAAKSAEICTCDHSRVSCQQLRCYSDQNMCYCFQDCQQQLNLQQKMQQNHEIFKEKVQNSKLSHNLLENKHSHISNLEDQLLISHTNEQSAKDQQLTLNNNQLLSSRTQEQSKKVKTISQEQIMKMMLKYNLGTDELQDILKNYEGTQATQEKDQKRKNTNNKIQDNCTAQTKKRIGKGVKKSNSSKYRNL